MCESSLVSRAKRAAQSGDSQNEVLWCHPETYDELMLDTHLTFDESPKIAGRELRTDYTMEKGDFRFLPSNFRDCSGRYLFIDDPPQSLVKELVDQSLVKTESNFETKIHGYFLYEHHKTTYEFYTEELEQDMHVLELSDIQNKYFPDDHPDIFYDDFIWESTSDELDVWVDENGDRTLWVFDVDEGEDKTYKMKIGRNISNRTVAGAPEIEANHFTRELVDRVQSLSNGLIERPIHDISGDERKKVGKKYIDTGGLCMTPYEDLRENLK